MGKEKPKNKYIMSSLNNALKVLDLLTVRDNIGVAEISRLTGIDKASVYKILYTLKYRDYVSKTENAKYMVGKKLSVYVELAHNRQNIVEVAATHMRSLRNDCGESVYLGVLNTNGRVIFIHAEDGLKPDSIIARIGYEIDAYTNAGGKILLANLEALMQRAIINSLELRGRAANTITSHEELNPILDKLRDAEWAEAYDENFTGHSDLAVPLFDQSRRCIAALSIVCPTHTLRARKKEFLPWLQNTAHNISKEMGYTSV